MVKIGVENRNNDINKFIINLIPVLLLLFIIIILSIAVYYSLSYKQTPINKGELNTLAITQEKVIKEDSSSSIEQNNIPQEPSEQVLPENIPLPESELVNP